MKNLEDLAILEVERVTVNRPIGYVVLYHPEREGQIKVTFEGEAWTDGRPANPDAHHYTRGDNDMGEERTPVEIKIIAVYNCDDDSQTEKEIHDPALIKALEEWLQGNDDVYEPAEVEEFEPEWDD